MSYQRREQIRFSILLAFRPEKDIVFTSISVYVIWFISIGQPVQFSLVFSLCKEVLFVFGMK